MPGGLPNEIWLYLSKYLAIDDIFTLAGVSKKNYENYTRTEVQALLLNEAVFTLMPYPRLFQSFYTMKDLVNNHSDYIAMVRKW
jgi:hypothetical protein